MKIFLDENFPLTLQTELADLEYNVLHVISENLRGITDQDIVKKLQEEELLFFTKDDDFLDFDIGDHSVIVLSRIPQSKPIEQRISIWKNAVVTFYNQYRPSDDQYFEVKADGTFSPLDVRNQ